MKELTILDIFIKFLERSITIIKVLIRQMFFISLICIVLLILIIVFSYYILPDDSEVKSLLTLLSALIGGWISYPHIKEIFTKKANLKNLEGIKEDILQYHTETGPEVKEELEKDFFRTIKEIFKS